MSQDVTSGVSSYETTECPLRDAESVCCVLLGSGTNRAWHSKLNRRNLGLSLHTLPPTWQETAWQTLMCFPGSLKGNEAPTPPESQGWFPLQLKMLLRLLFFIKLSATVLLIMFGGERSQSGGKMRKEDEKGEEEEEEWPIVLPVVIWQVMRGGTLLIYPHREKTSRWYRWHQDLFFLSSSPFFSLFIHHSR